MNVPPTQFIRVMPDDLRRFVSDVLQKVEVPDYDADLIGVCPEFCVTDLFTIWGPAPHT